MLRQENGVFLNSGDPPDDVEEDPTLAGISDSQITSTSSTLNITSGGTAQIEVNTTVEIKNKKLQLSSSGIQADSGGLDITNIGGATLALGIGVMAYAPITGVVSYSTTAAASGATFTLTLVHSGYSGINGIYLKETDSTGSDLISPNPTSFSPRLENTSRSIGTITSSTTTIAISANANAGSSSYSWSGSSTPSQTGFSSFYRVFSGFTNGSYTLTVTSVDDD
tara:strand:- start:929 stop:1600 length:672 start_codon:yes stop_codon:yes gene_type:complete